MEESREKLLTEAHTRLAEIREMDIYSFDDLVVFIFSLAEDIQKALEPDLTEKELLTIKMTKIWSYFYQIKEATTQLTPNTNLLEVFQQVQSDVSIGLETTQFVLNKVKGKK